MCDEDFQTFYQEHARRLWAYIARISSNPSVADDIVQESFLRLWELDQFDAMTPEHRRNYLYKIAANLVKRGAQKPSEQELADLPGPETAEQIHEWIGIRNALDRMKAAERNLLWLAYVEGFSHREIGAIAGYAENSVRPLLHRAKQRLLRFLSADGRSGREEQ
jgi:RNA polymerase sigma-70 factor (ECF subfamily)